MRFNFQEVVVDDASGVDSSEEDDDYMPNENEEYTNDETEDDKLVFDMEYIDARRALRGRSDKGLCEEVFGKIGGECEYSDYECSDGDFYSSEADEKGDMRRKKD